MTKKEVQKTTEKLERELINRDHVFNTKKSLIETSIEELESDLNNIQEEYETRSRMGMLPQTRTQYQTQIRSLESEIRILRNQIVEISY